jgi:hypothetical protein
MAIGGLNPVGATGPDPLVAALAPASPLRPVGGSPGDGFLNVSDTRAGSDSRDPDPAAAAAASSLLAMQEASGGAVSALSALSTGVQAFRAPSPIADFGSIRIDGVTTVLGAVDSRYLTQRDAAEYVAAAINGNSRNQVTAAVTDDGKLQLRGRDGGSFFIENVGALTTDQSAQAIDLGLAPGRYEGAVTAATAIASPTFAKARRAHAGGLDTAGGERRDQAARATPADQAAAIARQATSAPQPAGRDAGSVIAANQGALDARLASLLEAPDPPLSVQTGAVELTGATTVPGRVGKPVEPEGIIADLAAAQATRAAGVPVAMHIAQQHIQEVVETLLPEGNPDEEPPSALISFEV